MAYVDLQCPGKPFFTLQILNSVLVLCAENSSTLQRLQALLSTFIVVSKLHQTVALTLSHTHRTLCKSNGLDLDTVDSSFTKILQIDSCHSSYGGTTKQMYYILYYFMKIYFCSCTFSPHVID